MTHALCRSCETALTCSRRGECFEPIEWQAAHGVVSVDEYDDFTSESAQKDFLTFRDFLLAIVSMAFAFVSGVVVGVGGGVIARWMA
jgi:uncharacterized membrane protein (Fun14 family)